MFVSTCSFASMSLQTCLEDCMEAVDLFLNNRFAESLDRLQPHVKNSMYHALIYATVLEMQAMMTFEHDDIVSAGITMKSAQEVCQRFRKKSSSLNSKLAGEDLTEEQLHAEVCYAECLLQRAALTFLQDENMVSFIKGGVKVRSSYLIYKDLHTFLQSQQYVKGPNHFQLEGGVSFGIGAFNLVCCNIVTALVLFSSSLLGVNSSWTLTQRITSLLLYYISCCSSAELLLVLLKNKNQFVWSQQAWKQFHHMCYWELMWCFTFKRVWKMAYFYADLLSQESRWSKAMYVYMKAACLSMLPKDEARPFGENEVELFRQVPTFKQKIAGKSPPTEKFAIRKAKRYKASCSVRLPVPVLEMMYMWNGFTMIRSRPELTRGMMETLVEAEHTFQESHGTYMTDDSCVIQLLKGMCLKNEGQNEAAEDCFNKVCNSEKKIRFDDYLVPNALLELGLLYIDLGRKDEAIKLLQKAKNNYKEYSMESRTQFRIHAALTKLKADTSDVEESTDL
uniref:Zgc:158403 n=1 Tax=Scleropages formosus TaxID=113540 RepID=A0A8C9WMM7_SCLFO